MITHQFHSSPMGLEFAARKNQPGILLYRVHAAASENMPLRRGMFLKKANDFDVSNCTTKNIGSILKNLGFPLVLTFESAPKRGDESVRQAVLLKKVQRKFRAH